MDATKSQPPRHPPDGSVSDSLGSWKEIAAYLKRDERTVRRWQKEGLPVHRHMHKKQASVYAFRSQLDLWWRRDRNRLRLKPVLERDVVHQKKLSSTVRMSPGRMAAFKSTRPSF